MLAQNSVFNLRTNNIAAMLAELDLLSIWKPLQTAAHLAGRNFVKNLHSVRYN